MEPESWHSYLLLVAFTAAQSKTLLPVSSFAGRAAGRAYCHGLVEAPSGRKIAEDLGRVASFSISRHLGRPDMYTSWSPAPGLSLQSLLKGGKRSPRVARIAEPPGPHVGGRERWKWRCCSPESWRLGLDLAGLGGVNGTLPGPSHGRPSPGLAGLHSTPRAENCPIFSGASSKKALAKGIPVETSRLLGTATLHASPCCVCGHPSSLATCNRSVNILCGAQSCVANCEPVNSEMTTPDGHATQGPAWIAFSDLRHNACK